MTNIYSKAQEAWLNDLETTDALQTKGYLYAKRQSDGEFGYCCLGRLCEINGLEKEKDIYNEGSYRYKIDNNNEGCYLPEPLWIKLNLRDKKGSLLKSFNINKNFVQDLADLNDTHQYSFKDIAKFIRENPWQVFTNFSKPE